MRDEWYVARRGPDGNKRYGPVPLQQLRELVDTGKVQPGDLVWREGMANWQRADQCDDVAPPSPPREPRRDPRDYPADDRRGYAYDRGPRGYRPEDDDRPFRRYPPPRSSSGGWVVPLVIGGVVVGVCFLACAGLIGYAMLAPSYSPPYSPSYTGSSATTFDKPIDEPPVNDGEYGALYTPPGFNRPAGFDNELAYNGSLLYYTDNVTLADAQALGDHLNLQGDFPDNHAVTAQLDKDVITGTYQVRFCVRPGMDGNDDAVNYYRNIRDDVANIVFQNSGVEVHLCDGNMNTLRILHAGD